MVTPASITTNSTMSPYGGIPIADWETALTSEYRRLGIPRGTTLRGHINGTRPLKDEKAYECHYNAFCRFAYGIGDYSSLLMFDKYCPTYCIPPSVETMVAYVNHRLGEKGTNVVDSTGKNLYKCTRGKLVLCIGGWGDPARLDHFRAAMHAVMTARLQNHSYSDACSECVRLHAMTTPSTGCPFHLSMPLLLRTGDPTKDTVYANNAIRVKKASAWRVEGAGQLLPGDIRDVLDCLVSANSVPKLQIATMLLVSISLFLRKDEITAMSVSDFVLDLTIAPDQSKPPAGLNVGVKGKSDKHVVNLFLWLNNDTPDLCPLRFLLVYVYCAGIKEGNLFPTWEELYTKPENGEYTTRLTDSDLYDEVSELWTNVLKRMTKLGTHTCRKTGYLWAILGGGINISDELLHEIMQAARHKTFAVAVKYLQNARSLAENIRLRGDTGRQTVRIWKTPFVGNLLNNHRDLCMDDPGQGVALYEHARHFVEDVLGIGKKHPKNSHPAYVIKQAIAYQPDKTAQETLDEALRSLAPSIGATIKAAVQAITNQAMARKSAEFEATVRYCQPTINQFQDLGVVTPSQPENGATTAEATAHDDTMENGQIGRTKRILQLPDAPPRKRKAGSTRKGVLHLMTRTSYHKKLDNKDKLSTFLHMGDEVFEHGGVPSVFVDKDRQFISRFVIPVNMCFWNCCRGNESTFFECHDNIFKHTDVEGKYNGGCPHVKNKLDNSARWLGRAHYQQG
jgi:hypothetical protein